MIWTKTYARQWGWQLQANQWMAGYCAIAPLWGDQPWWLALFAPALYLTVPGVRYAWQGTWRGCRYD